MNLYEDCDTYKVLRFGNREDWLKGRLTGIGGSDASVCLGMNRWKSTRDLWASKTGRAEMEDISDRPFVIYGVKKEPQLRADFALDFEDIYEVQYENDVTLQNRERPYMLYSPDGLLIEKATGRKGIVEFKTHAIRNASDWNDWREGIGYDEYFIQVLHGLNVTGFSFVELRVELKRSLQYKQIRTYHIDIEDDGIPEQMDAVAEGVRSFWETYIETDTEPPVIAVL